MIKIPWFLIQLLLSLMLLLLSTIFAWYEGSKILEVPWEWNNSTPFSNMINGLVNSKNDILQIDFLIYAAKYKPTFPIIIVISSLYLLSLISLLIFKKSKKGYIVFLFLKGITLTFISLSFIPLYTFGAKIIFYILIVTGLISICTSILLYIFNKKNSI